MKATLPIENRIAFVEVVRPERLVYDHGSDDENRAHDFRVSATFEERKGKTHLILRSLLPSAEVRDYVVREFHVIEGGRQTLDRLEEHVTRLLAR